MLVDAESLGDLGPAALASALRPLWEDAGPLVGAMIGRRFGDWEEQLGAAAEAIAAMDDPTRGALLRAHPRIGTDSATLARRSTLSHREQGAAMSDATARCLSTLNDRYEERFGFPFVAWVAGRPPEAMIVVLEERLGRDRRHELDAGCAALVAIAGDRLHFLRSGRP
ncbi:MAG: 2-oxo-4-hydroxy-4-carboxy-5-ureidoimidazoline decarboxylase [Actinomycetota bacterium]|nr:2-oxo-4-hydroxy-4-carboxy-5-ureidoimidazoline decarboxylase [Actinomycetota bacterium]